MLLQTHDARQPARSRRLSTGFHEHLQSGTRAFAAFGRVHGAGAEPTSVLGHRIWQREFGGDRTVIGKRLDVNGRPVVVVGVTAPGFEFPRGTDTWQPMSTLFAATRTVPDPRASYFDLVARLGRDVDIDAAEREQRLGFVGLTGVRVRVREPRNGSMQVVSGIAQRHVLVGGLIGVVSGREEEPDLRTRLVLPRHARMLSIVCRCVFRGDSGSQRQDWIDAGCPPSGNVAGQCSHRSQDRKHRSEGHGVRGFDAKEKPSECPGRRP